MQRDLGRLANDPFDVLVVGGGVYGASIAREAALYGFRVALIEQGDFGHATSANSLKIVHGGLRYLQHGNLRRMRASIRARRWWLRAAPHLVQPLRCIIPTYQGGLRSRAVLAAALAANDVLSSDRNIGLPKGQRLPRGRLISRQALLDAIPGIDDSGITGGAEWYDATILNTERMNLTLVRSAARAGACVANYVQAQAYVCDGDRVSGVEATDLLTGDSLCVRARVVVNAAGPWQDRISPSPLHARRVPLQWTKAMNIVVRKPLFDGYAVGLTGPASPASGDAAQGAAGRQYFFVPWRRSTLIGTFYAPYDGEPADCTWSRPECESILDEIRRIYPAAALRYDDVHFCHVGLLPRTPGSEALARRARIWSAPRDLSLRGLILVAGVKYTTAPDVARRVGKLIVRRMDRDFGGARQPAPLWGAAPGDADMQALPSTALQALPGDPRQRQRLCDYLASQYGNCYPEVLSCLAEDSAYAQPVCEGREPIGAQVIYAVRTEQARTLADVVLRRTELGSDGDPGRECLEVCARLMARELAWDESRIRDEIDALTRRLQMPAAGGAARTGGID